MRLRLRLSLALVLALTATLGSPPYAEGRESASIVAPDSQQQLNRQDVVTSPRQVSTTSFRQDLPPPLPPIPGDDPPEAIDKHAKLDSQLAALIRVLQERGEEAAVDEARQRLLATSGISVRVVI